MVVKFRILDAQITAIAPDKPVIVRHGLSLVVEEGRYETIPECEPACNFHPVERGIGLQI